LHPQFGTDVTFDTFLNSLQTLLKEAPKVVASDAQLLMIEHYHKEFGIAEYSDQTMQLHPLNHVAMHPAEDPITGSFLVETLKRFANLKVGDIFHISLESFLNLPHDMCELLFEIAEPMQKETIDKEDKILSNIERSSLLLDQRGNPFRN